MLWMWCISKENISPKKPQHVQAYVKSFGQPFEGQHIKGAFENVSIFFYPRMTLHRPFLSLDPTCMTLAFLIIMDRNLRKSAIKPLPIQRLNIAQIAARWKVSGWYLMKCQLSGRSCELMTIPRKRVSSKVEDWELQERSIHSKDLGLLPLSMRGRF